MPYLAPVVFDMWAPNTCVIRPLMFTAARTAARAECQSSGNGRFVGDASTIRKEVKIPTPSACIIEHQTPVQPFVEHVMAKNPFPAKPLPPSNSPSKLLNS